MSIYSNVKHGEAREAAEILNDTAGELIDKNDLIGALINAFVRIDKMEKEIERMAIKQVVKRPILDVCCGTRMMWFDKQHPAVVYGDIRSETIIVKDTSHRPDGTRTLCIEPDTLMDFRDIPYPDASFKLIAFDPPHLERAGPKSWLKAKYGKLSNNWRDDLRQGFTECFRVLDDGGTLVFKWNETQIKVREVLELAPTRPLFGQVSGRSGMTHWLVFMKGV